MTPKDFIDHYGGTQKAAAEALGVNQSTVSDWQRQGRIPYLRQLEIQEKTRGKLKAEKKGWKRDLERCEAA